MITTLLSFSLFIAVLCSLIRSQRILEFVNFLGAGGILYLGLNLVIGVYQNHEVWALRGLLRVDALGALLVLVISIIGFTASIYSHGYIRFEVAHGNLGMKKLRRYYFLLHTFIFTIFLVVVSNNLGILWIAIEATTLASAGLVAFRSEQEPLEAAWKYMIICSVGIAIGLFGTVLTYYSSVNILGEASDALNWSTLVSIAHQLDPKVMRLAFLFIVIGYGTKVGLAPMHTWLPDAHSQAPSPVSGLLSGVLLSCAMYGILRFYIITQAALGPAYPSSLLLMFGLASLIMAALFLIIQKDFKRMLAYSSLEHMGIIAVGLSFPGALGPYGAMFHLFNNAMAKSMMFFAAGNILLRYGTKEIEKVKGLGRLMPVTGTVFLLGALAMTGAPPFSLFVSELTILAAGFSSGAMIPSLVLLFCVVTIFASILSYVNFMTFGVPPPGIQKGEFSGWSTTAMLIHMTFVMMLGFYIPKPFNHLIHQAVQIISGS